MSAPVFVADADALSRATAGTLVSLAGDEARHAITVVRIRVGERVDLVDGLGRRVSGPVAQVDGSSLAVLVESVDDELEPAPRITVVQALPKGERGELAVELLTEIGVDEIVPWSATNCVAVWKGERAEKSRSRWISAARVAAKQSRRARFPIVAPLATTADIAARIGALVGDQDGGAVVLHESARDALGTSTRHLKQVLIVVGPEGGITDTELAAFEGAGAVAARIGPTVLRTSSAGMAAAAAVLSASDRWSTSPSRDA